MALIETTVKGAYLIKDGSGWAWCTTDSNTPTSSFSNIANRCTCQGGKYMGRIAVTPKETGAAGRPKTIVVTLTASESRPCNVQLIYNGTTSGYNTVEKRTYAINLPSHSTGTYSLSYTNKACTSRVTTSGDCYKDSWTVYFKLDLTSYELTAGTTYYFFVNAEANGGLCSGNSAKKSTANMSTMSAVSVELDYGEPVYNLDVNYWVNGDSTYYSGHSCGTFDVQVGSWSSTGLTDLNKKAVKGTSYTITPRPASGYTFDNRADLSGVYPENDFSVYIYFRSLYKISYNKGSYGTGTNKDVEKAYGKAITLDAALFTRTGYTQTAWASNAAGTTYTRDLSSNYTENTAATLYPYWTANTYTVSFDSAGGSSCNSITVTYNSTYGTLPTPTLRGYRFTGWKNGTTSITSSSTVSTASDHTLTATWAPLNYKVSYILEDDVMNSDSRGIAHSVQYNTLYSVISGNNLTRISYKFVGWTTNSDRSPDNYNWTNYNQVWTYIAGDNGINTSNIVTLYPIWEYDRKYNINIINSITGALLKTIPAYFGERFTIKEMLSGIVDDRIVTLLDSVKLLAYLDTDSKEIESENVNVYQDIKCNLTTLSSNEDYIYDVNPEAFYIFTNSYSHDEDADVYLYLTWDKIGGRYFTAHLPTSCIKPHATLTGWILEGIELSAGTLLFEENDAWYDFEQPLLSFIAIWEVEESTVGMWVRLENEYQFGDVHIKPNTKYVLGRRLYRRVGNKWIEIFDEEI